MARRDYVQGLEVAQLPVFPPPVEATRAPTSSDINYELGQVWVRKDTAVVYILAQLANGAATWTLAAPGASDVDTLTGDTGGAISPSSGNITLAGGTNIASAGSGNTITFNLDAAISLATSVTSPLYLVAAATDMAIRAATGQDIIMRMGDAAGVNKISFQDSANVEVAAIDSNGGFSMGAITFTGLLTASASATIDTAGTALNLGTDNSGDAVNLGTGTVARDIHIGDSAAAHTITIGSATGVASLDLLFGTGNFSLDGPTAGTITVGASLTTGTIAIGGTSQTGTFTLGGSSGAMTMNIANANGAKTINIGNGVSGNTLALGNGINTSAQTINIANGASAADTTINIMSGVGTAGAGVLAIGNNTRVTTIGLGNIAPAAARTTTIAGGDSAQDDTVNVLNGAPSAGTQTVSILSGNATGGTQVLNLANGNRATTVNVGGGTGGNTINIGTGINGAAQVVNVMSGAAGADSTVNILTGNATAGTITLNMANGNRATAVNFGNGTGGNTLLIANGVNGAAQIVSIANGASGAAQTVNILSGNAAAGTQTLNLAEGTGGKTVNIATGAGVNAVTIGSTNTTSSLILQAGSGEITVTGTVKEINAEFLYANGTDLTVQQSPILQSNATTGAAPTGSNGDVNLMYLQDGCLMEQFIIGAQTIIAPRMTANGLDLALDNTVSEGAEYNFGARNNAKHAYTIGTSAAFFIEATIYVTDYSGCLPLMVGFRKVEANNAVLADYTDYAAIGINSTTSGVNATILSELNAGGQTATDTTDALPAEPNSFKVGVFVSAAGVVTFELQGSAVSAAPAYTFDNADVVMPFIHFLNGADVAGEVSLSTLKIGFQA